MSIALIDVEQNAYRKAIRDTKKRFDRLVENLPTDAAQDLCELFALHAKALADGDGESRRETSRAIREILFPDSLKVELEKEFFEEDPAVRHKLDRYRAMVGAEIKKRREQLGMTQDQLAEKAGLPQSHVSRLERGKHVPTHVTMERLAAALDTSASQLDPGFDD